MDSQFDSPNSVLFMLFCLPAAYCTHPELSKVVISVSEATSGFIRIPQYKQITKWKRLQSDFKQKDLYVCSSYFGKCFCKMYIAYSLMSNLCKLGPTFGNFVAMLQDSNFNSIDAISSCFSLNTGPNLPPLQICPTCSKYWTG